MDNKNNLNTALISTPTLKVLDFLLQHPEVELNDTEIAGQLDTVRKSAVNLALRALAGLGLVKRVPRGRMVFNSLVESPLVLQLKTTSNLVRLAPLIEQMKPLCLKIILFGSRAEGTHRSESDFDLLAIVDDDEAVRRVVRKSILAERIQLLMKKPEQALTIDKDEPVLSRQVKKGIVLWQRE